MIHEIFIIIVIISIFFVQKSYASENFLNNDDQKLVAVLESYWQWWANSPEDNPENNPKCSMNINKNYSFVFLQNSFGTGNTDYDCTESSIPQGYSIMFPLITSFCSQGDVGLINKPFNEIRDCALNLERGTIQGNVILDSKEIVNLFIDNGNGIDRDNKKIINNLLLSQYHKEIFSEEFINILATNRTILLNNWESEEFKKNPVYYKGVIHCDCIIINTNELESGLHNLEYIITAKADPPSPSFQADRWDFRSHTNYKLIIQ